jgi:hypothetical protein
VRHARFCVEPVPVNVSSPAPGSSGAAAASRAGNTRLTFSGCRAFPQVNGRRIGSAACSVSSMIWSLRAAPASGLAAQPGARFAAWCVRGGIA